MSNELAVRNSAVRHRWFRRFAEIEFAIAVGHVIGWAIGFGVNPWLGLFPAGLGVVFMWLTHRAAPKAVVVKPKPVEPVEPVEPESSIVSDAVWWDLAYGAGSVHHATQQLIDRIQYELDEPERRLRDARRWATELVTKTGAIARRIIATQAAIDRSHAEAKEFNDFVEWMGDDGVRRDGTQGPVRVVGNLFGMSPFSAGGWVQDVAESRLNYDDGVSFCLGRRVFTKRFVKTYDPNQVSYISCDRGLGLHFHRNDGSA